AAVDRYHRATEDRKLVCSSTPAGTANILATDLPAPLTTAVMRRINHLARAARSKDDPRTMDQIRADVFLDLLNGDQTRAPGRGIVDIRVDLTTLIGLDDKPGELAGFGPVVAEVARRVVASETGARHRVTVTDGDRVVWSGTTRRRPTTAIRDHVQAETPTCIFPGCRMPASQCDIDHRQPWSEGGSTTVANSNPLCRRDHIRKHKGWHMVRSSDGMWSWISPLGRVYPYRPMPP
ncbi:MAG: HNH endonuclease, partial [Actinobacteria bacterium]|nr:HNH endonuclease [Actinomycetota bacterium]